MQGKNSYFRHSHISEAKFRWIVHFTGLENRRAEWCKPSDDQSVVIQTTNPNRPALWRLIALLRRGWSRWILLRRAPCSWENKGCGVGGKTIVFGILERHGKGYTG